MSWNLDIWFLQRDALLVRYICCRRVCLFVRALTEKQLELSTLNFVHVYSIAVARHALTQRSKGQWSRSHSHETRRLLVIMYCIPYTNTALCDLRPLPAWVYMSIRLPMFSIVTVHCCTASFTTSMERGRRYKFAWTTDKEGRSGTAGFLPRGRKLANSAVMTFAVCSESR